MRVNTLFKGMTRPALVFGIPTVPLFFVCAVYIIAIFIVGKIFYIIGLVPIILFLRVLSKYDEKIFNNFYLKIRFINNSFNGGKMNIKRFNLYKYFKSKKRFNGLALFPNSYRKNQSTEQKNFDIDSVMDCSGHIPYSRHITEQIIMTKDGDLVTTWKIHGVSFETASDDLLEDDNNQIHQMIRSLASTNDNLSFYYQRVKSNTNFELESTFSNPFARIINKLYFKQFQKSKFKKTELYFTVLYRPLSIIEKRTIKHKDFNERKEQFIDDFVEIIRYVDEALKSYEARILKLKKEGNIFRSEAVEYYNFLLTGEQKKIRLGAVPIYEILSDKGFFFIGNTVEIKGDNGRRFARCIEIKEYSDETFLGFFDGIQYLDVDMIMTHSFSLINKKSGLTLVERQQNLLSSGRDKAVSQIEGLDQLQDDIVSGHVATGYHHFSLFVFADTFDDVVSKSNQVAQELQSVGFITTFADIALPSAYFGQLPGNFQYRPRLSAITSLNFANFCDMHNFYRGKREGNPWGKAVTLLDTLSKQPLYFNFHEETMKNDFNNQNLGNTSLIGSSGTGKTLFLNFLLCQAQKFSEQDTFSNDSINKKATFFYLDKDFGAEANVKALGGKYLKIENGKPTGFNPFMIDSTEDNIEFLFVLFKHLVTLQDKTFTVRHQEQLYNAIKSVMNMPKENRIFGVSRLLEFLPKGSTQKEIDSDLSTRLAQWTFDKKFGWVFDNELDELIFDEHTINYGFDGTDFLENKTVSAAISYYLIYRIMQLLDGRRFILFIDEFWMWLNDPIFSDFVYDKLKTIRKMNGLVVTATQSPDEVLRSNISAAVLEQTETQIFMANPKGKKSEYCDVNANTRSFGLSDKEFYLIKNFTKSSRLILIKKSNGSSIAKVNLAGLGEYLKVLSTSKINAELLNRMGVGMQKDPKYWLKEYLERSL